MGSIIRTLAALGWLHNAIRSAYSSISEKHASADGRRTPPEAGLAGEPDASVHAAA